MLSFGTFRNCKDIIRKLLGAVFFYGGLFHIIRLVNNLRGKRLTIVIYHRVGDDRGTVRTSPPWLTMSQRTFEKQLRFFSKWYKIITFSDLERYMTENALPWNALIITFDDGYADNYLRAYPILKRMKLKATIFITAEKVGDSDGRSFWWDRAFFFFGEILRRQNNLWPGLGEEVERIVELFKTSPGQAISSMHNWEKVEIDNFLDALQKKHAISEDAFLEENRMLNWEEIARMDGDIEFESHTCKHHNLMRLDEGERIYEINESKQILERRVKKEIIAFSYPHGYYDEDIKMMVKKAGYQYGVTTRGGINDLSDRYGLKRINLEEETSLSLRGKFSNGYFAYKLMGF